MRNRLWNCTNPWQGNYRKVLCVCSAGLLRSPTAARVIAEKYNFNTRACGCDTGHALILLDQVLLNWADEIVVQDSEQFEIVKHKLQEFKIKDKPVQVLGIQDSYAYMDENLVVLINERYDPEFYLNIEEKCHE